MTTWAYHDPTGRVGVVPSSERLVLVPECDWCHKPIFDAREAWVLTDDYSEAWPALGAEVRILHLRCAAIFRSEAEVSMRSQGADPELADYVNPFTTHQELHRQESCSQLSLARFAMVMLQWAIGPKANEGRPGYHEAPGLYTPHEPEE